MDIFEHLDQITFNMHSPMILYRENVESDMPRLIEAVLAALRVNPEDAATSGRDFGRGYALALKDVHEAIDRALNAQDAPAPTPTEEDR